MDAPVSIDPKDLAPDPAASVQIDPQDLGDPVQGEDRGRVAALTHAIGNTGTFGLMDTALSYILPSQMWARYRANLDATNDAHPLLNLVGEGTGMVMGGGPLSAVARGLKAVPLVGRAVGALELQKGQTVRNAARAATTGAVAGGATAAISDPSGTYDDPTHALVSAGIGAVGGPVASAVAAKAAPLVGRALGAINDRIRSAPLIGQSIPTFGLDAEQSGWAKLADKLDMTPDDLTRARSNYAAWTGAEPSMPEIMDMQARGQLQRLATANPEIAEQFNKLNQTERTTGITLTNLVKQRNANMDAAMGSMRDDPLPLSLVEQKLLLQDYLPNSGIARSSPLREPVINDANKGFITVGNADTLRQSLNQLAIAKPGEGYKELATNLSQWAEGGHAGYKTALDNYRADSQVIDGFEHGLKGKSLADVDDPLLQLSLSKPTGQAGYNVGTLTKQGRDNISDVTPGHLSDADQASLVGHAAGGFLAHSMAMTGYHLSKLTAQRLRLNPQVADQIGAALSDPQQAVHAIQMLRNAGATNADIRALAMGSAASAGANMAGTQTDPFKGAVVAAPGVARQAVFGGGPQ